VWFSDGAASLADDVMKTERLPTPGMLFGHYPERRPRGPSWIGARAIGFLTGTRASLCHSDRHLSEIRRLERALAGLSDSALRERTFAVRAALARDGLCEPASLDALAIATLACGRALGIGPYDTQLLAACVMLSGGLAEMATGEGKTLAVALAAATGGLAGIPVHVVTANDYLVKRDADTMGALYRTIGLSVGAVTPELDLAARRAAYAADITYCTARELAFDYLRDRLIELQRTALEARAVRITRPESPQRLLRGLCMAIIDEADSVLIDEARLPLILSRPVASRGASHWLDAWQSALQLRPKHDFVLDASSRGARLTPSGEARVLRLAETAAARWPTHRHCADAVKAALVARHLLVAGRDYLVKEGAVTIIDPTTGRTAPGRAWSQGLQQFVEIKENLVPGSRIEPLAQITYQRFFPRYHRLCGVSGTLLECREELMRIYGRRVARVPLRRPNQRKRYATSTFRDRDSQHRAVVARVAALHARGRPVLIGTDSVIDSEALSSALTAAGLPHAVLNARQDHQEARIIARAGSRGAITVATNMAGRGTDIVLQAGVADCGGLHVISCQQNPARRLDRQLAGRCARQGEPGSAETYIALDGPLLASHWFGRLLGGCTARAGMPHSGLAAFALRWAQRARERRDRVERELMLKRDEETSHWFAFSGHEP
jgi:preprotein translocase subunit SecA